MKKFLLSVIAIVAMSVNALAQEIHVPDDLNGWYAGYYVVTAVDVETLKNGVDSFCTFDGLGGDTWTESQQALWSAHATGVMKTTQFRILVW